MSRRLVAELVETPLTIELDVSAIDSDAAVGQLKDRGLVAGLAMRKLQALHCVATPGVTTAVDVVLGLIDGVLRALVEAPDAYMQRRAALCDWDQEFDALDNGLIWRNPQRTDEELEEFSRCTATLGELHKVVAAMAERGCHLLR
ncbi:MAG: hypothetical protein M3Y91_04875 [Actinomycetota bacterium]|nr:hypothetical protein [Actinomycetota bacterium]